jgi:SAM-dependent methyltransferase
MNLLAPIVTQLKRVRALGTFWIPDQSPRHVEALRLFEIDRVLEHMPSAGRLLEIGAGTGWQARLLQSRGYEVVAVDIPSSNYRDARNFPIFDYDGRNLPFADQSFDIVFSSNTLEHIPSLRSFDSEMRRVLKTEGIAVHVLPSASWRMWTNLSHVLKYWSLPGCHGETAGNAMSEILAFRRGWWRKHFFDCGWQVASITSSGLYYSGNLILGERLSLAARARLSGWLGSSCNIFVLCKRQPSADGRVEL